MSKLTLWDFSRLLETNTWKVLIKEQLSTLLLLTMAFLITLFFKDVWIISIVGLFLLFILLKYMCRAVEVFSLQNGKVRLFKMKDGYQLKMPSKQCSIHQYNKNIFPKKGHNLFIFCRYNLWYLINDKENLPKLLGEKILDTVYRYKSEDIKLGKYQYKFNFDCCLKYKPISEREKNVELLILQFDKFVSVGVHSYTINVYVPLGKNDKIRLDERISQSKEVKDNFKPELIKSYLLINRHKTGLKLIAICQNLRGESFFAYVIAPTLIFNTEETHIYVYSGCCYKEKYHKFNVNRKLNGRIIEIGEYHWYENCHIWEYNPETKKLDLVYQGVVTSIRFDTGEYTEA